MKKLFDSGAIWPVVFKALALMAFALVSMVVGFYASAGHKQATGWVVNPKQDVMNIVSLLKGFGVIFVLTLLLLGAVGALLVAGVKSVRKGGTGPLIIGLIGLVAAVVLVWFGANYILGTLKIDSYRATWYLPAFFGLIAVVALLSSRRKRRTVSQGRSYAGTQRGSAVNTESVPVTSVG